MAIEDQNSISANADFMSHLSSQWGLEFYSIEYLVGHASDIPTDANYFAVIVSDFLFIGRNDDAENHANLCCLFRSLLRNNPELAFENIERSLSNFIRGTNAMSPSLSCLVETILTSCFGSADQGAAKIWCVNGHTLNVFCEALLPATDCPKCQLSQTSNIAHELQADFEVVESDTPTRLRSIDELVLPTLNECVAGNVGLVQEYAYDLQMPFGSSSAWSAIRKERREPTLGRSSTFAYARTLALIEALERNAGIFGGLYREPETTVASFSQIKDIALNPIEIGLHEDALYDQPDFPFARFDPDETIEWVKGYDLTNDVAIWVPYCFSFYGPSKIQGQPLAYETSNGCATGSSLSEAILHGLFELIERDSFLNHWYLQSPPPKLSIELEGVSKIRPLIARAELFTHSKLELFDSTKEHGIPSVIASLRSDIKVGPATAISAGAGLTFSSASKAAIYELVGHFLRMKSNYQDSELLNNLREMYLDPSKVKTMEDHGLVNALPEATPRFDHFLSGAPSLAKENNPLSGAGETPCQVLSCLVERLRDQGMKVIAINQTTKALSNFKLTAAKVIVPGMLPMTFGHKNRRTALPKLDSVMPHAFIPHPFP